MKQIYQNLWTIAKAVLKDFIIININIFKKKKENFHINNLTFYLKEPNERTKPKVSRRKEITRIRVEINEIVTKNTIEKMNETKLHFENINKIVNLFTKKKGGLKEIQLQMKEKAFQQVPHKYKML